MSDRLIKVTQETYEKIVQLKLPGETYDQTLSRVLGDYN